MIQISTKKKISFYTFGCRLNQAETAIIRNSLNNDYEIVDFEQPADIVVVNTCTVTENGDADTRRLVTKINRLNPQVRIALIGCQAQVQKEKLADLSNVFWVIGNGKKFDLATILRETENAIEPQVITPTIDRDHFTLPAAGIDIEHTTRANLKIQDGCDFFCSFCEIPYARGRARSRELEDILKEARILAKAGHQEIILTGINIGTYLYKGNTLLNVIDSLEQIEKIKRIRISSIEPTTIPLSLIDKMADPTKLCRYLHIPLQSGDDSVLTKMQRKYSVAEFSDFVEIAAARIPDICLGTDIIVGFPGEGEKEFENTCEFFRQSPLNYCHVFSYSKRHMAKSKSFADEVPAGVIQQRSEILRDLSQRKRRLFYEKHINKTYDILFEHKKHDICAGFTDNYIRVAVKSSRNLFNEFHKVKLSAIKEHYIQGEPVSCS